MTPEQTAILKPVTLLLLDVDGVLTDGRLIYAGDGPEIKNFHVKDGLGIKMVLKAGIEVGIVTGRSSTALTRRCQELGIGHIYDGIKDKGAVLDDILAATQTVSPEAVAFIGDDLPDIPLLKKVGAPITVANAHPAVQQESRIITSVQGGFGAVREVCEMLLHAKGLWQDVLSQFS